MHVCSAVSDSLWPMDCSPPGSSVHGILQARILEWVDISYSKGIFLTQRSNLCLLCLLHWQADSLYLWNPGSPKALVRERERECVCVCVCVCVCSVMPDSLWLMDRFLCPWTFPGKNTGVGCHFLLQRIFLTPGSNSYLLHLLHWLAGSLPQAPPQKASTSVEPEKDT